MPRMLLASACLAGLLLATGLAGDSAAQQSLGEIAGQPPPTGSSAGAQATGAIAPATVAVVDVQAVMQRSLAGQGVQRQLDEQRTLMQKNFAAQEDKVRESEQELARLRQTLSPEAFDEKRREFERQVGDVRRIIQDRTRALETAFGQARESLFSTVIQLVREVSAEQGATLVVPSQNILLLRDPSLDLTDRVLRRLNERLPQIVVNLPPPAQP